MGGGGCECVWVVVNCEAQGAARDVSTRAALLGRVGQELGTSKGPCATSMVTRLDSVSVLLQLSCLSWPLSSMRNVHLVSLSADLVCLCYHQTEKKRISLVADSHT